MLPVPSIIRILLERLLRREYFRGVPPRKGRKTRAKLGLVQLGHPVDESSERGWRETGEYDYPL